MQKLINSNVQKIEISGIRKFSNMMSGYDDVISLTIGQPDFPTPEHVKKAGIRAIENNFTKYTHNAGIKELRVAASNYFSSKYNMTYNPDSEIIVTNGASEAIDTALRTILEEGSEVILPDPVYPAYAPIITLCGAVPIYADTTKSGFVLTAEIIKSHITSKTRCVILPSPSNPTGCTMSSNEFERIAELLCDKDIFVLSDEIYSELIYDSSHISISQFKGMRDKTLVINGLSKSHSMTGWRIGFLMGPEYIIENALKVHQYNSTCAAAISQYAALEAVTNGLSDAYPMRDEYKKRRDYVYMRLKNMGIDTLLPGGAFYIFPSIKKFNLSSFDFCTRLLKEKSVGIVPGSAFGSCGEGYVRISYACSMDNLIKAMDRLEEFVSSL